MRNKLKQAAWKKGIDFLLFQQENDGGFASASTTKIDNFSGAARNNTVFYPALMMDALKNFSNKNIDEIRKKVKQYLLDQRNKDWSYNFWKKGSLEYSKIRIPNDLDDTFVVLTALQNFDRKIFTAGDLAKITKILTDNEDNEGGPYRTWMIDSSVNKRWVEVDLAVNVNIANYLSLNEISLPKLDKYIDNKLAKNEFGSKYYVSVYPVIYFLSRYYCGRYQKNVWNWLLKNQKGDGSWGGILDTSLALNALYNFGERGRKIERGIEFILNTQNTDGSWRAEAFCFDQIVDSRQSYSGSESLTTGFCLEILGKMMPVEKKYFKETENKKENPNFFNEYKGIIDKAKNNFTSLPKSLARESIKFLNEITQKDKDGEIVLLPYFFWVSLRENKEKISAEMIEQLCLASLYGWMAYTIYDDFLDEEAKIKLLPVANFCLRELTNIYHILGEEKLFGDFINQMEEANIWEVGNCRFDREKIDLNKLPKKIHLDFLADKSIGHALGPVVILKKIGLENYFDLAEFFENYLIARQLNDDAHDWEEDLKRGQLNFAGLLVLKDYANKYKDKKFDLEKKINNLRLIFWQKTIKMIVKQIRRSTRQARLFRKKIDILDESFLENKLLSLEKSANKALIESNEAMEFIKNY